MDTGVFELIQKGGFFVYPIILCSIVGLAIFLQKMWILRSKNIIPELFLDQLYSFLSQGKLGEAEVYARANNSSISRIALAALENSDKPKEELREEIEEAGRKETLELMRYTEGLGTISSVSTLLGLLGTISGMIKIFKVIADKPIVNPPELAGGISEALYTTAFGLLVAIPAFIAYKYIVGRADELISLMEEESRKIMEFIIANKQSGNTPSDDTKGMFG